MQDDGALRVKLVHCALTHATLDTGAARARRVQHSISAQLGLMDRPRDKQRRHALAFAALGTGVALARRVRRKIYAQ